MKLIAQEGYDADYIVVLNRYLAELCQLPLPSEVRRAEQHKLMYGLMQYRNLIVLRLRGIADGLVREFNAGNLLTSVILGRQLLETAAHFIHTAIDVEKQLAKKPADLVRLDRRIKKMMFGSGSKHGVGIAHENVLNCIDTVDELMRKLAPEHTSKNRTPIRDVYDFLSELVHPNNYGLHFYCEIDKSGLVRHHPNGSPDKQRLLSGEILIAVGVLSQVLETEQAYSKVVSHLLATKR